MDFITDLKKMECVGAWGAFCHTTGCPVTLWLSAPGDAYTRFDLGDLRGFAISRPGSGLPVLTATYDEALCLTDGVEATACSRDWVFDTNTPEIPDYTLSTAAAPAPRSTGSDPAEAEETRPEPQPAGWTLREVPGASPLALGSGTGIIASLSAFCLQSEPFMAVRFTTAPPPGTVTLEFTFSSGRLALAATHEPSAGGAFVMDLTEKPLAAALAGRDSSAEVSVDGTPQGTLSLRGSTKALRTALADCASF